MISRRRLLRQTPVAVAATGLAGCVTPTTLPSGGVFAHGVASGDPLADRVILWTRVSTSEAPATAVRWSIAEDEAFTKVRNQGEVQALASADYTVKIDAGGLDAGRTYYYRFTALNAESPIGRTRTLPSVAVPRVRLAVASCANYPYGYFNVYRRIAERSDLDAVIHLGDYLYEYEPGNYDNDSKLGRRHFPPREILSLSDYRLRHAQYKTDPDLQEAHRLHPWICVWDDHESTNNSWQGGAENHNAGEGDWQTRKRLAIQAYHEWLPIRAQPMNAKGLQIYRNFRFGKTADLIMLDTRLHGRSEQLVDGSDPAALRDPKRSLLGQDQAAWLQTQLAVSNERGAHWRVLGQQCMFGQLEDDDRLILNTDQWDGYPLDREAVLDQLEAQRIHNTVVLTGDIHSAWGLDITRDPFASSYDPATGKGSLAVELICSAVTSPTPFGTREQAAERERTVVRDRPHIHWVNFQDRGYLLLDLDDTRAQAQWWLVDTVERSNHTQRLAATMVTESGANHLVQPG